MVVLENLSCTAGTHLISDVSLAVKKGEYFSILGPTGAGKTVLLECIAGLIKPGTGKTFTEGRDITNEPPETRGFGYVPQDYVLFPFLTVRENIFFGCRDKGEGIKKRLHTLSGVFGIEGLMERKPEKLSGGEKQRVSMVRALARAPKLLLLDEPYSSIDEGLRRKLWLEMRKLHRSLGTTVIHITHDLEEAFTLSDNIAVLIDGRIEQKGSREDIFYNPRNRSVAGFMGFRNLLTGIVRDVDHSHNCMVLTCGFYNVVTPCKKGIAEGMKVEFCVLPQEIKIIKADRDIRDSLRENVFEGRIVNIIPHGVSYTLYFKITKPSEGGEEFDFEINIPSNNYKRLNLEDHMQIKVALRKNAIHIFEPEPRRL